MHGLRGLLVCKSSSSPTFAAATAAPAAATEAVETRNNNVRTSTQRQLQEEFSTSTTSCPELELNGSESKDDDLSDTSCHVSDPEILLVSSSSPSSSSVNNINNINININHLQRNQRSVRFSVVQIQEYKLTLGDHPCAQNFPMSLDWEHTQLREVDLTAYEATKKQNWLVTRRRPEPLQRLTMWDRCVRLAQAMDILLSELQVQEQQRQSLVLEEVFLGNNTNNKDEEEEDFLIHPPRKKKQVMEYDEEDWSATAGEHFFFEEDDMYFTSRRALTCKFCEFWE